MKCSFLLQVSCVHKSIQLVQFFLFLVMFNLMSCHPFCPSCGPSDGHLLFPLGLIVSSIMSSLPERKCERQWRAPTERLRFGSNILSAGPRPHTHCIQRHSRQGQLSSVLPVNGGKNENSSTSWNNNSLQVNVTFLGMKEFHSSDVSSPTLLQNCLASRGPPRLVVKRLKTTQSRNALPLCSYRVKSRIKRCISANSHPEQFALIPKKTRETKAGASLCD